MKTIQITKHVTCHGGFSLNEKEQYKSIGEGMSSEGYPKKKFYLVETNTKRNGVKLPLAVYENECVVLE